MARWLAPGVLAGFVALVALLCLWLDDVWLNGVASMRGPQRWMAAVWVLAVPALTMRTLTGGGAGEWEGTLPLTAGERVLGAWGSVVATATLGLVLILTWAWVLSRYGELDWGPVWTGTLGLWLWCAMLAAVGVASSAWARSQAVAFGIAVAGCGLLWLGSVAVALLPPAWSAALLMWTATPHLEALASGVLEPSSVLYLAGGTVVGLRIAVLGLEQRRLT